MCEERGELTSHQRKISKRKRNEESEVTKQIANKYLIRSLKLIGLIQ